MCWLTGSSVSLPGFLLMQEKTAFSEPGWFFVGQVKML